jgi:hypothetical protein
VAGVVAGRNDDELDSVDVEAVDGGLEIGSGTGGGRLAVVAIGADATLDLATAGVD